MLPAIALFLALFAAQTTTPPPPTEPAASPATSQSAPAKPPCRNPDASGKYHIGCGVTAPRLLRHIEPQYSQEARNDRISGDVLLSFTVDTDGNPTDVHIIRSLADALDPSYHVAARSLDQKALDAVKQYKFAPATYRGRPVPVALTVKIHFQIS